MRPEPLWPRLKSVMDARGEPTDRPPPQEIAAVVDTNVIIDVYSCHDLTKAEPEDWEYRVSRARDSLLLAIYFDEIAAKTSGISEYLEIIAVCVPPGAVDTAERQFTGAVIYFVKDHVLSRWTPQVRSEKEQPRGSAADALLVEMAATLGKPLITNEGEDKGLRRRAKERGVWACTPREFWNGKLDVDKACRRFLARFRSIAPQYAAAQSNPRAWQAYLDTLYDHYYRRLLLDR